MAGPVESYAILLDDTGYTGKIKKLREQQVSVSSRTEYQGFLTGMTNDRVLGAWSASLSQLAVSASAHDGISTAFFWAFVPAGITGRQARIRIIYGSSQHASISTITSSAPRVCVTRFTFTGTASGAQVAPSRSSASLYGSMLDLRTASTGITVTLGAAAGCAPIVGSLSEIAAHACPTQFPIQMLSAARPDEANNFGLEEGWLDDDELITLQAGEGVVVWQDVAGTTSETRKLNLTVAWDEVDVS